MSGARIGQSIVNDVAKQLGVQIGSTASIKISEQGKITNNYDSSDKKYADLSAALKKFDNLPQEISNAVKSDSNSTPEHINPDQRNNKTNDKSVTTVQDYSKQLSQIITGVLDVTTAVNNGVNSLISTVVSLNNSKNTEIPDSKGILSALSDNTSTLKQGSEAILRLVNSIEGINTENKYSFTTKDYSSEFAQVVKEIQSASNAHISAINGVANAVNSVEVAVKSQEQSEEVSFDTGALTQAIISEISPFISTFEQISQVYQSSSSLLAENVQSLELNIDTLSQSLNSSISALSQIENAISSLQGQETRIDLTPVSTELQEILTVLKSTQNNSGNSQDFVSALSPITTTLQNISAVLPSVQNTLQANIQAVNDVETAITVLENTIKSQQTDKIIINEGSITQAVIAGFNPLISRIEQNSNIYQASSAAVSKSIQDLDVNIEALRKSAESSNSAILQLQTSVKAAGDSYDATNITRAINPLTEVVQNLAGVLTTIQNINQASNAAILDVINSVRSLESTVKSLDAGNNYDIDINQQGFIIEKKSDADMLARSTVTALRSGLGNGGV